MVCVQLCVRCKALKSFRRFILRRRRITFVHPIVRSLLDPPSQSESVPRGVAFTAAPATSAGGSATAATALAVNAAALAASTSDAVPAVVVSDAESAKEDAGRATLGAKSATARPRARWDEPNRVVVAVEVIFMLEDEDAVKTRAPR